MVMWWAHAWAEIGKRVVVNIHGAPRRQAAGPRAGAWDALAAVRTCSKPAMA